MKIKINLFTKSVTLFYGKNGVGNIKAIAIALGLNPEGGSNNMQFLNYDDYSELYKHLTISKLGVPKTKFFLRAESFYNVATDISNNSDLVYTTYGGEDLHSCSHGELFLKLVTEVYRIYKDFLNNPYGMQKVLFEE